MDYGDRPQMVFGEIRYPQEYDDVHAEMVALIRSQFSNVEAGLQGDSWIWILDGDDKVAIDTFSSMKHQVKSCTAGSHVQRVIDALRAKYDVQVFEPPVE
tara:strand:- start:44 stop:343 length:300 start_codon:yes stop_codon:yes gene_type:complete